MVYNFSQALGKASSELLVVVVVGGGHVAMAGKAGILFVTFFKQTFAMYLVPFSNLWMDFSSSARSLSLCSLLKASGMSGTNGR